MAITQEERLRRVGRFILRHSNLCLLLGGLWLAVGIYASLDFRLYDEPGRWAPQSHPLVERTKAIEKRFGGSNHVEIMVSPKQGDIYNPKTLEAVERITSEVLGIEGVIPYTIRSIADTSARYMRYEIRNGDGYIVNRPLLNRVPEEGDSEALGQIRWGAKHNPLIDGALISPDGTAAVVEADFRTAPTEDSLGNPLPHTDPIAIYQQVETLRKRIEREYDHEVSVAGTPILIGWVNSEGLVYLAGAFAFFLVVIAGILYAFIGRLSGAVLPILVGLYAALSGFAIYSFVFGNVLESAAVLISPFIVVAAGACHAVQFIRRLFDESLPQADGLGEALADTFAMRFKPMLLALVSDTVAFVVLSFIPFANVSLLGQVTTFGLLSVTVAEFLLLMPGMYWALRGRSLVRAVVGTRPADHGEGSERHYVDRVTERVIRMMVERRSAQAVVLIVVVIATGWSLTVLPQLEFAQNNTYAIHNALTRSWRGNPIYEMEMEIRERFGGIYPLIVMLKTRGDARVNEDLSIIERMDAFEQEIARVEGVEGALGLPDHLKVMNRLMHEDREEALALPPSSRALGEYVFLYQDAEPGVFDAVVSPDQQHAALRVMVANTQKQTVSRVMAAARAAAEEHLEGPTTEAVIGGGAIAIAQAFNDGIGKWLLIGGVLSAAATLMVIILVLRSITMPLLLLLPLVLGVVIAVAIMHALGLPMDSNMTIAVAIASGVGIDSGVYLLFRFREEFAQNPDFKEALITASVRIFRPLLTSNGALILGCWALVPIPLYVGIVGFGMGLVLLLCFSLGYFATPALWSALRPAYLTREVRRKPAPGAALGARGSGRDLPVARRARGA